MIGLLALGEAGRPLADAVHRLWPDSLVLLAEDDGEGADELLETALRGCRQLVCFAPVGATVRLLLRRTPAGRPLPGVVCVDPERRFAVSLTGASGGADDLAGEVSALLDTCPVITSGRARDPRTPARPAGAGHDASVGRHDLPGWDFPEWDEDVLVCPPPPTRPPGPRAGGLVVGVGLREAAAAPEVTRLIRRTLREAGLPASAVARLSTLTGKGGHPAVRRAAALLGLPVDEHTAEELSAVAVPNPSASVGEAVGTMSVAEAAALASAPGGELVVPKRKSATATVAVARAAVRGRLAVIGLGPGERDLIVPRAEAELRRASVVVGAPGALAVAAELLRPAARRLTAEDCLRAAVELASRREAVALVALGDGLAYAPPASDRYALVRIPGLPLPHADGEHS
ncbi:cobalamin biosynthesis protein [Kitasatospora sp. NBC_00085]|uniref:cobalamin biosynthesis protein n=1 Tax=Kitasatospora sp. NBC_00085 TaxID=2903566 RepID=UPI00324BA7EF